MPPSKKKPSSPKKPPKRPLWAWPRPRAASDPPRPRFLDQMVVKREIVKREGAPR